MLRNILKANWEIAKARMRGAASLFRDKKGQVTAIPTVIFTMASIGIAFLVVGLTLGAASLANNKFKDKLTGNTTEYNAVSNVSAGMLEFAAFTPEIGIIAAIAILLGVIFAGIGFIGVMGKQR